jgi:nucleoside-diphosphate-sugar epimerase
METCVEAYSGRLELVLTRPFNYTGVGQQPRYVVPKIVDHFRRRAGSIELGNVDVRRDFGDVRSVAEAYSGLILAKAPPRIVNISGGRDHSIREIVEMASAMTGHRPAIAVNPEFVRTNDVPLLVGDHGCLSQLLPDWRPRPIEETLGWMLAEAGAR